MLCLFICVIISELFVDIDCDIDGAFLDCVYFYFKSKPLCEFCIETTKRILVLKLKLVSSLGKSI